MESYFANLRTIDKSYMICKTYITEMVWIIFHLNVIFIFRFGRNEYFDYMCNEPNEANSLMPSKKKITCYVFQVGYIYIMKAQVCFGLVR